MSLWVELIYWPLHLLEGYYKIGSVRSSVLHLSACFLGIGSLYFSEFCYGARNRHEVKRGRAKFFWKSFYSKIGEIGQKRGFLNLKKKLVINFYWICFFFWLDMVKNWCGQSGLWIKFECISKIGRWN